MKRRWVSDITNEEIGVAIRFMRHRHDVGRPELAKCAGVSALTIYYIENGERRPGLRVIQKISGHLRISLNALEDLAITLSGVPSKAMLAIELEADVRELKKNEAIRHGVKRLKTILNGRK